MNQREEEDEGTRREAFLSTRESLQRSRRALKFAKDP